MSTKESGTSAVVLDATTDRRLSKKVSITTTGAIIREENEHSLT